MGKTAEELKKEYLMLLKKIGNMIICPSCAQKLFGTAESISFEYDGIKYQITEGDSLEKTCGIWECRNNAGFSISIVPQGQGIIDIRARYLIVGEIKVHRIIPIEINLYEPVPDKPGYVKVSGRKTIKDVFEELEKRLKAQGFYPDEYFSNNNDSEKEGEKPFPEFRWISCFAVTGDSEGHYIHVEIIYCDEKLNIGRRDLMFLGKSFQGMDYAFEIAKICAKHMGS